MLATCVKNALSHLVMQKILQRVIMALFLHTRFLLVALVSVCLSCMSVRHACLTSALLAFLQCCG
jgi:hypothetical protein